jgi:tetratricopeptide (TPR) repeat protein
LVDGRTRNLALRAGDLLASAGSRALQRNDVHAALKLLRRAVRLRPETDPAVALRLDLAQSLLLSGDLVAAAACADEAAQRAAVAGEEAGEMRARLLRARIGVQLPSDGDEAHAPSARLLAVAEEARDVFARAGDDLALAEAWFGVAWAQLMLCHCGAMLAAIEHATEHARRAGSARWQGELPAWQGTAMFYGPTSVEEAIRWYEEQHAGHPIALTQQAMLEAMRGNFDEARTLVRAAEAAAEDFGQRLWLAAGGMAAWQVETLAGDDAAAEVAVRRSCELLEELGEFGYRWVAVAELAASLFALDRLDDAEELAQAAEEHTSSDDVAAQMLWRQVRAKILARRGAFEPAEQLARDAVSLAESTDMLNMHADALADLAEVYRLGRRIEEARQQLERALGLYEEKGNVIAVARVRRRVEELA